MNKKILVDVSDLTYIQAQIELGNVNEALDILAKVLREASKK